MGEVTVLAYAGLKWTDKEVVAVSKVIATGVLRSSSYSTSWAARLAKPA